jgi:cell division protein FtsI (penicillin-binding protein 3)
MRPFLVKEILDPHGQTIRRVAPKEVGRVISPQTAQTLTRMLTSVVSEKGTGARAALEGFRVAGKTGTAQKPDLRAGGYRKDRYTASFAGFVPAEDPRICLVVLVDEPKEEIYGGQVAAPLFREIARDVLGILGVYADRRLLAQGPGLPGGEP